ncbi:MAG TPA: biotin-dependent carboxyltransferase family protein [Candidatus Limnocylindria bacterium]|nr:biotin-dependent carboxyltransferase family protein [Candidatus Limnocylindria bacterium]
MIRIDVPGLHATIQDAGRTRHLRAGVSTAGPADRVAHAFANALVGNDPGDAAIEIAGLPFAFVAERASLIAVTGRHVRLVGRDAIPGWTCAFLRAGDEARIEGRSRYAYLAAAGGFETRLDLGSRSSYPAASLGAPPLTSGSVLATRARAKEQWRAGRRTRAPDYGSETVRVIVGPHEDRVDIRVFLAARFVVDERSDRMGARLRGAPQQVRAGELVTTGVVEGAIQVPAAGDPIVLLADHQTTGGYPVVATVIAVDLPIVAQREPDEPLRFVATTDAEAVAELQRVRREVFALREASD